MLRSNSKSKSKESKTTNKNIEFQLTEPAVSLEHFALSPRPAEVSPVTAWLLAAATPGLCVALLSQCAVDTDEQHADIM